MVKYGEIILGLRLTLLNISLGFLQVLLFLMAPAAFRSHAKTSSCVCMHAWLHACMVACMHVCVDACMDVCMDICIEPSQINRVLSEVCTQLGMLRCKIYVVVFLGEPNT